MRRAKVRRYDGNGWAVGTDQSRKRKNGQSLMSVRARPARTGHELQGANRDVIVFSMSSMALVSLLEAQDAADDARDALPVF